MRKEASNTFTDGLVMDANPINMPKTALSDCLNGTFLTYDGNELTLQNDKGNYKLKGSELSENFMPIGIASYGDILYVISYNPITEESEIGSFPSPNTSVSGNLDTSLGVKSILSQAFLDESLNRDVVWEKNSLEEKYKKDFIFYNIGKDDLTINPGDVYSITNVPEALNYERLKYTIFANSKDYSVNIIDDGEEHPVSWEVAGYLKCGFELPTIDEFEINNIGLDVPKISFNGSEYVATENFLVRNVFSVNSSDGLIKEAFNGGHLKVKYSITNTEKSLFEDVVTFDKSNSYSGNNIYFANILTDLKSQMSSYLNETGKQNYNKLIVNASIYVTMDDGNLSKDVLYGSKSIEIFLPEEIIATTNGIEIAKNLYRYKVPEQNVENSATTFYTKLSYNLTPSSSFAIKVAYSGFNDGWTELNANLWTEVHNFGDLTFDIPFKKYDFYVIRFEIINGEDRKFVYKFCINDPIMNVFMPSTSADENNYQDFDKINLQEKINQTETLSDYLFTFSADSKYIAEITNPVTSKLICENKLLDFYLSKKIDDNNYLNYFTDDPNLFESNFYREHSTTNQAVVTYSNIKTKENSIQKQFGNIPETFTSNTENKTIVLKQNGHFETKTLKTGFVLSNIDVSNIPIKDIYLSSDDKNRDTTIFIKFSWDGTKKYSVPDQSKDYLTGTNKYYKMIVNYIKEHGLYNTIIFKVNITVSKTIWGAGKFAKGYIDDFNVKLSDTQWGAKAGSIYYLVRYTGDELYWVEIGENAPDKNYFGKLKYSSTEDSAKTYLESGTIIWDSIKTSKEIINDTISGITYYNLPLFKNGTLNPDIIKKFQDKYVDEDNYINNLSYTNYNDCKITSEITNLPITGVDDFNDDIFQENIEKLTNSPWITTTSKSGRVELQYLDMPINEQNRLYTALKESSFSDLPVSQSDVFTGFKFDNKETKLYLGKISTPVVGGTNSDSFVARNKYFNLFLFEEFKNKFQVMTLHDAYLKKYISDDFYLANVKQENKMFITDLPMNTKVEIFDKCYIVGLIETERSFSQYNLIYGYLGEKPTNSFKILAKDEQDALISLYEHKYLEGTADTCILRTANVNLWN